MTLLAPERLALVLVPIALAILYLVIQRRRTRFAMRFTTVDLLDTVAPNRPGWRRHLAAAVYLVAVALLVVGMARPVLAVDVPTSPTIVLAIDVSYSMDATDVAPSRIQAARDAAGRFLDLVPAGAKVGLVAFSESARAVLAPTTNHAAVRAAITQLKLGPGTAIGDAISVALQQLPKGATDAPTGAAATPGPVPPGTASTPGTAPDSGARSAGAIVLLSDGKTTAGRSDGDAAKLAQAQGVPVSTIAFGTASGTVTVDGQRVAVPVDKPALQAVARTTGGTFFEAASADQLKTVFENIGRAIGTTKEDREVTDYLVGAALAAAVVAALGSLLWFSRLP